METKLVTEGMMIQAMKEYATKNKVFDAVCHMWAFRKRARRQVTIAGLAYAMKKEGFKAYSKQELSDILLFLSKIGVGKLRNNGKELVGIDFSLQSLGKAAITGKETKLGKISAPAMKFKKVTPVIDPVKESEKVHVKKFVEEKQEAPKKSRTYPAFLTVMIEGKPIKFKAPDNITADNLMEFLTQFKEVMS